MGKSFLAIDGGRSSWVDGGARAEGHGSWAQFSPDGLAWGATCEGWSDRPVEAESLVAGWYGDEAGPRRQPRRKAVGPGRGTYRFLLLIPSARPGEAAVTAPLEMRDPPHGSSSTVPAASPRKPRRSAGARVGWRPQPVFRAVRRAPLQEAVAARPWIGSLTATIPTTWIRSRRLPFRPAGARTGKRLLRGGKSLSQ